MYPSPRQFFIGVDLGKLRDYTAIVTLERYSYKAGWDAVWLHDVYEWKNVIRLAERLRLGTSYPAAVSRIRELTLHAAALGEVTLIVDRTGVGEPVVDALRLANLPCSIVPVTITSGENATRTRSGWNVPKRELIVCLQMMFARSELTLPADLPLRKQLAAELSTLTRQLKASGSGHDDLVIALALSTWRLKSRKQAGEQPYSLGL